ncbi:transcription antitermination factor NusB [Candidatus Acetothermia bacterium]|nr:MAG: transcription antitermination factor NusB [Candidatus Acetothermia bacterium]RLE32721.1 MAG: transcription antitermination factor NusB [Candidatus Acetothermia bacterium]
MRRHEAREVVLRLLYRLEFKTLPLEALLVEEELNDQADFIRERLVGILQHREEIDGIIDRRAQGWGIDRLATVDRNILRLGIYELLYTDVPPEVAIDEAVELAKEYGTEKAPSFINAILDRVWKEKNGGVG